MVITKRQRFRDRVMVCVGYALGMDPKAERAFVDDEEIIERNHFAMFCYNNNLKPEDVGELCLLAQEAHDLGVRSCNEENFPRRRYDAAMEAFEAKATSLGIITDWPGLYPGLKKDGYSIHLPIPERGDDE